MSVADSGPEAHHYPLADNLAILQESVIWALGDVGRPLNVDTLVSVLPGHCQEIIDKLVSNLEFPGKNRGKPVTAFIEHFIAAPHAMVAYEYGKTPGYVLNEAGIACYREIIERDEREKVSYIPETQPADNSLVRGLGGGALAAVWSG